MMLPLETKLSRGKLLPHSDRQGGGGVSRRTIKQQALQREALERKEEETAQLQDWNVGCKNLEWRRQIGKFEKGNAEE